MIAIKKLKKIKSNFPILGAEKAILQETCKDFVNEIRNSKVFDDMIMAGRSRINKGSKNFKSFINNSKHAKRLYKQFNSFSFYKKIENIFKRKFKHTAWVSVYQPYKFQKEIFTPKKKYNSCELKKTLGNSHNKTVVHLDMNFSVAKGGYRLKPHRDDITRYYNFLIYLNNIPKSNGGCLTIYK